MSVASAECRPMAPTPEVSRDSLTGVQIRIGVMGSAGGFEAGGVLGLCRELGRVIAEAGCCLLTGACPGLPHEAVVGAKEAGGHVVGISPAASHIRSSDIVVVIGDRSGTLGEFAIAYEEGKLIGVLTGTGGITDALSGMVAALRKDTGAEVIYDDVPGRLVERLLKRYRSGDYVCPCKPTSRRRVQ